MKDTTSEIAPITESIKNPNPSSTPPIIPPKENISSTPIIPPLPPISSINTNSSVEKDAFIKRIEELRKENNSLKEDKLKLTTNVTEVYIFS